MNLRYIYLLLPFLCSCTIQPSESLKQWWNNWKEYSLTQMASETTSNFFSEETESKLLVLFLDLEDAANCTAFKKLIETNATLTEIGEGNNFNVGFLFDALYEYDYEKNLLRGGARKNSLEDIAFLIVGTWKKEFTLERINKVLTDIKFCYPYSSS